jgi:ABC-type sugar transport system substrate-binding protein
MATQVSVLIQAPNPNALKTAIDALLAAGKEVVLVTSLADKSWYLIIHTV